MRGHRALWSSAPAPIRCQIPPRRDSWRRPPRRSRRQRPRAERQVAPPPARTEVRCGKVPGSGARQPVASAATTSANASARNRGTQPDGTGACRWHPPASLAVDQGTPGKCVSVGGGISGGRPGDPTASAPWTVDGYWLWVASPAKNSLSPTGLASFRWLSNETPPGT